MKLGLILSLYLWCEICFTVFLGVDILRGSIYGVVVDFLGIFIYSTLTLFSLKDFLKNE